MSAGRRGPSRDVDWNEVHAMLAQAATAGDAKPLGTAEVQAILEARARVLARVPPRPPDASEVLELATFHLNNERFAIETRYVRRIIGLGLYEPVPGTPDVLRGVTNSGGEILALFDLRVLFGGSPGVTTEATRVVILGDDREEFGVLADAADEVVTVRLDELHPGSSWREGADRQLLRGVTADALIVIDGGVLLRDERLVIDHREEPGAESGHHWPLA